MSHWFTGRVTTNAITSATSRLQNRPSSSPAAIATVPPGDVASPRDYHSHSATHPRLRRSRGSQMDSDHAWFRAGAKDAWHEVTSREDTELVARCGSTHSWTRS